MGMDGTWGALGTLDTNFVDCLLGLGKGCIHWEGYSSRCEREKKVVFFFILPIALCVCSCLAKVAIYVSWHGTLNILRGEKGYMIR